MDERAAVQEQPAVEQRSLVGQIRLWGGIGGAALLVLFLVQNLDDARVRFLFWKFDIPLIFALIASAILGAVAVQVFGFFRRRAKEAALRERAAFQRERDRER